MGSVSVDAAARTSQTTPTAIDRRYRITEGTEEIQMRRVAGYLFGLIKRDTLKGVTG
jgi:hypothetical protein